jgi:hypothetical protein
MQAATCRRRHSGRGDGSRQNDRGAGAAGAQSGRRAAAARALPHLPGCHRRRQTYDLCKVCGGAVVVVYIAAVVCLVEVDEALEKLIRKFFFSNRIE